MKRHPPGRCMDQSCRGCYSKKKEPDLEGVAKAAKQAVNSFRAMADMDRQFMDYYLRGNYVTLFTQEPRTSSNRGTKRWDPNYCWICAGPCFVREAQRRASKPYENGNVIEGEVVHHHDRKAIEA